MAVEKKSPGIEITNLDKNDLFTKSSNRRDKNARRKGSVAKNPLDNYASQIPVDKIVIRKPMPEKNKSPPPLKLSDSLAPNPQQFLVEK